MSCGAAHGELSCRSRNRLRPPSKTTHYLAQADAVEGARDFGIRVQLCACRPKHESFVYRVDARATPNMKVSCTASMCGATKTCGVACVRWGSQGGLYRRSSRGVESTGPKSEEGGRPNMGQNQIPREHRSELPSDLGPGPRDAPRRPPSPPVDAFRVPTTVDRPMSDPGERTLADMRSALPLPRGARVPPCELARHHLWL